MIPASFDYYRASTVDDAVRLLGEHEDAKVLAGGHSLIPLMKLRLASPPALVDIGGLGELSGIREAGDEIVIGALTRHYALETSELLRSRAQLVPEAAAQIGDVQVRNRGTVGGSLVHADPGADLPAVMLALDANMTVHGAGGDRTVAAGDFFVEMLTTDVQPNEILTDIRFRSLGARTGSAYVKFPNPASGYSVVGAAAVVGLGADGSISDVRVGISGAAAMPLRASDTESALRGAQPTDEAVRGAAQAASNGIEALEDIHASAEYRLHLTRVMTRRALESALSRARG
jgi:aerobic carbon-monoxide dehydrogenase medium subunit